jgi:serine/threonine protein kinase
MLYHLLTGAFPFWAGGAEQFHGMTAAELRDGICRGTPMFLRDPFEGYSPSVRDLLMRMLEKDPERRLSAATAAGHQWFAEVLGADAASGGAAGGADGDAHGRECVIGDFGMLSCR